MNIDIILPCAIIGLAFVLKLTVDRSTTTPDLITSILELPVDIMFLAISLMVGLVIAPTDSENHFAIYLLVLIILAVLVVLFWRKAAKLYEANAIWWTILPAFAAYAISVTSVFLTVRMIGT